MAQPKVIEGTWEEIVQRAEELRGHQVRLIVFPQEATTNGNGEPHFYFTATPEEFERAFDAIGNGNERLPILPPEAFERESIYEGIP